VAAYPVTGPIDVVRDGVTGVLSEDLRQAALQALELDPAACRAHALAHSWEASTRQFLSALAPVPGAVAAETKPTATPQPAPTAVTRA
jgi:hypothetical protein